MIDFSILFFLDIVLLLAGVLLGVAFFTLMERKVMGYAHFRKGPTKILYFGLLQPIGDAVKLFSKEYMKGESFSFYFFFFAPLFGLILMFFLWGIYGGVYFCVGSYFSFLFVFCLMSLGVYFLLLCCWGSTSKYSLLGGYRAISQTVSYEVSMIFFVLCFVYLMSFYDFYTFSFFQGGYWMVFLSFALFLSWFMVCLAESNRTPYDFSEGESELVSGFNTEYGGGGFSLIFICEYGMIIYLSFLSTLLFFGGSGFFVKFLFLTFVFVLVRCCYPRHRYDMLMDFAWKVLLPVSIFFLLLMTGVFF